MILTVTPNPCIERTIVAPDFTVGVSHRITPQSLHVNAGGKGINAVRVAAQFGPARALAWVGKGQRLWFETELAREGIAAELVEVEADTRITINVVDGKGGKTEIVEAGNPLRIEDGTRLLETYSRLLDEASLVAIGGSYPPNAAGARLDLLGNSNHRPAIFDMHLTLLVQLAQRAGKRVLVDSKGTVFEMAVRHAKPWCITPNVEEAEALLHCKIEGEAAERRAVEEIRRLGIEIVLLTCGERGCWLGTKGGLWFLHSPSVFTISPVGSGDSLVGAFLAKYHETGDILEATRWGVAAGAANAAQLLPAFCTAIEIEALVSEVVIAPASRHPAFSG
jgi:1-phosphofructokinase family hexose kinase